MDAMITDVFTENRPQQTINTSINTNSMTQPLMMTDADTQSTWVDRTSSQQIVRRSIGPDSARQLPLPLTAKAEILGTRRVSGCDGRYRVHGFHRHHRHHHCPDYHSKPMDGCALCCSMCDTYFVFYITYVTSLPCLWRFVPLYCNSCDLLFILQHI